MKNLSRTLKALFLALAMFLGQLSWATTVDGKENVVDVKYDLKKVEVVDQIGKTNQAFAEEGPIIILIDEDGDGDIDVIIIIY